MKRTVTAESVTSGHPDKVCDQISDRILDEVLNQDPDGRVACEVAINDKLLLIMGEITTTAFVDYERIAKDVLWDIGYLDKNDPYSLDNIQIIVSLNEQAPDIAIGVNEYGGVEHHVGLGAGDQGLMIGYACNETVEYMPLPIVLAHGLTKRLEKVRKDGIIPYLKPDGKAQVTVGYEGDTPTHIEAIVVSSQHKEGIDWDKLFEDVYQHVIKEVIPEELLNDKTTILINPTGRFIVGGPKGDSGLTGRKIIVDTYGGIGRHGGGAFSGKDPSKVDRSGAYMARYIAKNIVAAELATKCEVELAFAIGHAEPLAFNINTFGTGKLKDDELARVVQRVVKLGVSDIIHQLDLCKPIYSKTSVYGHFGKDELPWESLELVEQLQVKYFLLNKSYNDWFKDLTVDYIETMRDLELLEYVMPRPGHKGHYGFLVPGNSFLDNEKSAKILTALLHRLSPIPTERIAAYLEKRRIQ